MDALARPVRAPSRDHGFYLGMAIAIAVTVIGGFGQFAMRGLVDVARVPFWVHVHAVVFVGWTLLFVTQNALVHRREMGLHRRLGWATVGLAVAMVPLAAFTAAMSVTLGRVPPFFPIPVFVALNLLELSAFILLMTGAVRMRRRTDWHKRLMLFAMIAIIGPAFGRILPMPLLGQWGGLAVLTGQMLFVAPIIVHDLKREHKLHPATMLGAFVLLVEGLAVPLLATTSLVAALTQALLPA